MKIKIQPGLDHITDRADLLQDFVVFVCKDLQCMPCPIDIVNGRESSGLKTTAQYDTQNHHVMVNAKNRHFGDVLRSIAHELVHHKQNVKGELNGPTQDIGGDIEDEANARAGALLKSFAYQKGPERIYEGADLLRAYTGLLIESVGVPAEKPKESGSNKPSFLDQPGRAFLCKQPLFQGTKYCDPDYKPDSDEAGPTAQCEAEELAIGSFPLTDNNSFSLPMPGGRLTSPYGMRTPPKIKRQIRAKRKEIAAAKDQAIIAQLTGELKKLRQRAKKKVMHKAIDVGPAAAGTNPVVQSIGNGVVYSVGKSRSYGNFVQVNYFYKGKPIRALYSHLDTVSVKKGDCAYEGGPIGTAGKTGTKYVHLHLELWTTNIKRPKKKGGMPYSAIFDAGKGSWTKALDPLKFLPSIPRAEKDVKALVKKLRPKKKRRTKKKK